MVGSGSVTVTGTGNVNASGFGSIVAQAASGSILVTPTGTVSALGRTIDRNALRRHLDGEHLQRCDRHGGSPAELRSEGLNTVNVSGGIHQVESGRQSGSG